jgi:hypothetical protein
MAVHRPRALIRIDFEVEKVRERAGKFATPEH